MVKSSLLLTSACFTFKLQYPLRVRFLAKTDISSWALTQSDSSAEQKTFFQDINLFSQFSTILKTPLTISSLAF